MKKIPSHKLILLTWAAVIGVGSLVTQFAYINIMTNFTVWTVLIILGIAGSSYATDWKSPMQRKVQTAWIILIVVAFAGNYLGYRVPGFAVLAYPNIYIYWTVVAAIGYFFTGRDADWPAMTKYGLLSLITIPLYLIDGPLSLSQPLVYGVVQCGLLLYFVAT